MPSDSEIKVPASLAEGLAEIIGAAERRGYVEGYVQGRSFSTRIDASRDVFIVQAHSSLGNWRVESCAWSANGPDFYVMQDATNVAVFQTEEEARSAAERAGYRVSELEPHAPGMRRQHVRPPYPW